MSLGRLAEDKKDLQRVAELKPQHPHLEFELPSEDPDVPALPSPQQQSQLGHQNDDDLVDVSFPVHPDWLFVCSFQPDLWFMVWENEIVGSAPGPLTSSCVVFLRMSSFIFSSFSVMTEGPCVGSLSSSGFFSLSLLPPLQ